MRSTSGSLKTDTAGLVSERPADFPPQPNENVFSCRKCPLTPFIFRRSVDSMRKVQVYTITNCPYCERAKALLRDRQIAFEEVHVDRNDDEQIQELIARSKMKTFPQIFAGDKLIGG